MKPRLLTVLLLVGCALVSASASAQTTLAEAAAAAAKIKHEWPLSGNVVPLAPVDASALPGKQAAAATTDVPASTVVVVKKDEAYWKNRKRELQAALDTDSILLNGLTLRVASLSAEFNSSPSVSQRAVIRQAREAAATEETRAKAAVGIDQHPIDTFEEDARLAGVLPGWLRLP